MGSSLKGSPLSFNKRMRAALEQSGRVRAVDWHVFTANVADCFLPLLGYTGPSFGLKLKFTHSSDMSHGFETRTSPFCMLLLS